MIFLKIATKMIKLKYILIGLLIPILFSAKAQQKDTLLFIVDQDLDIVDYRMEKRFYETKSFVIAVDCKYYGEDDDFAKTVFFELREDFSNNNIIVNKPKLKLSKSQLSKYDTLNVEWLYKQKSLRDIMDKVGFYNFEKYYYIIFKEDLDDTKRDSITIHQCMIGYNEEEN